MLSTPPLLLITLSPGLGRWDSTVFLSLVTVSVGCLHFTLTRIFSVEVISVSEDELVEVTPKVSTQLPISKMKSNFLMNTEKHLSSANHFPANSRIFNRSLKELQTTARAISQSYLAEKGGRKAKRGRDSTQPPNKRIKIEKMRSILRKNNNHLIKKYTP